MNQFQYVPRVIALTGNIASGKSTVARLLRERGAHIVDADELARKAVAPGSPALQSIKARWGDDVIHNDGTLNRGAIADIVFNNEAERLELNAIVHPEVERLRRLDIARGAHEGAACTVCDIPLLFETGLDSQFDYIVLVDAPETLRRQRLMLLRGLSRQQADAMIRAQEPSEGKRPRSHLIIENASNLDDLVAQVEALWLVLTGPTWPPKPSEADDVLPSAVDLP